MEDGPESSEFGIAALDVYLDGASLSFPVAADDVVAALDDPEIPYDPSGNAVALSTVVERTDRERFDSRRDIQNALHPEFERYRRTRRGLFTRLRALVSGL